MDSLEIIPLRHGKPQIFHKPTYIALTNQLKTTEHIFVVSMGMHLYLSLETWSKEKPNYSPIEYSLS